MSESADIQWIEKKCELKNTQRIIVDIMGFVDLQLDIEELCEKIAIAKEKNI